MSSRRADGWSLTRRMSVAFATTTSSIVLLYGALSSYIVFDAVRDDVKSFMAHELSQLEVHLVNGDATTKEQIAGELEKMLSVDSELPHAFRVRDPEGVVLVEDGPPRLLGILGEPVTGETSWRRQLISDRVAVSALTIESPPATLEIVVNVRRALEELWSYLRTSLIAFVLSVVLAGLAGYWVARRGLRSLRDVVDQALTIEMPASRDAIRLDDAPVEIREVGQALNDMLRRIDVGLKQMRTFTAGLAHELRSPLQNLIGETEVTLLTDRTVGQYRALLASNLEDLHEMSDSVDNLVAYCRGSNPADHERSRERFDLADESRIRIDRLARHARSRRVDVRVRVDGDTSIEADREACLRLVRNLVANAIEWSPHGGRVTVDMIGRPTSVRVEVRDQGPGIPDKLRTKIYEPFVSGRTSSGRRAGYGLGLAICRSVVDDHDGRLRHERVTTGGTRFVAELPRDRSGRCEMSAESRTSWSRRGSAVPGGVRR